MLKKKHSFASLFSLKSIFILFIIACGIFIATWNADTPADITSENISIELRTALEENNTPYFKQFTPQGSIPFNKEIEKYSRKMEIYTFQEKNFIFFSFLGLAENSSIIHSIYGSLDTTQNTIELFPTVSFAITGKTKKTLTLKNISDIAVPIDEKFLLLPAGIHGKSVFSQKVLLPEESFVFHSQGALSETIDQIESLTYGYNALIK